jgi:hypothetical protein
MGKNPIKIACPFCKAPPDQNCKSVEGHKMMGFHHQRLRKEKTREGVNQAAAPVIREVIQRSEDDKNP